MQKGAIPKACKNTQKRAKERGRMRKGCNQTSRKNVQKAIRLKGAIRVQKGAIPKACKNTQKRAQLGEPVSTRGWASQYRAQVGRTSIKPERVGRTSIKNGVGRASIERRLGGPVSSPSGLGEPSPSRWVSKTQQKGPLSLLAFFGVE